ncbi:hypothetical protein ES703_102976 [subsurface metagenome]
MRRITFFSLLGWVSRVVVVFSSIAIVLVICIEVILRYVFRNPVLGFEEIALMTVAWLWFFGAASASQIGFHISGGLPVRKQSVRDIMGVAYPFVSLTVTVIYCYLCFLYCQWLIKARVISLALQFPWIWSTLGVFLGLVLNAVYLAREAGFKLGAFRQRRHRGSLNEP